MRRRTRSHTRSPHRRALGGTLATALLLAGTALAAQPAAAVTTGTDYGDPAVPETAGYEGSYTYVRTLEGSATLIQGDTGDRDALQANQPVLVGDRVWVAPRGRAELVLSDGNLLRVDGGSEVVFEALAASPDRQDRTTVLRLPEGNIQLVVVRDFLGEGLPRIDTPNSTIYPRNLGTYRITAGGPDWSQVVARDGSAEVVTPEGAVLVRAGEEAIVEGQHRTRQQVRRAGREDSLELWGERLDRQARQAAVPYVDESLRYEAAALERHGSWLRIEGRYAWRPRVGVEWRPYWHGRWAFSPLGLTWVSNEPWGWVPYHYGSWDHLPGHGWVWFPGYRFAPAWVYWYWTDAYAGWVPLGYYTRHYHARFGPRFGFHSGVYGWAGGHWSHYDRWIFCSTGFIGHRHQTRFVADGRRFPRKHRIAVPRRGILTTDTRGIDRNRLQRGDGVIEAISGRRNPRDLPDVTDFVARRPELPDDARGRILVDRRSPDAAPDRRAPVIAVDDGVPTGTARNAPERGAGVADALDGVRRPAVRGDGRAEGGQGGNDRAPSKLATRPAVRPDGARGDDGSAGSWRTPDRSVGTRDVPAEAPSRPPAAGSRGDFRDRTPQRVEPRPAPPSAEPSSGPRAAPPAESPSESPSDSWRGRPEPDGVRGGIDRVRPAPARPGTDERPSPSRVAPGLRPSPGDRGEVRRVRPDSGADRPLYRVPERRETGSRPGATDRSPLPRRVIEEIRSNRRGSTPFRPAPDAGRSGGDAPRRVRPSEAPDRPSASPSSRPSASPSRARPPSGRSSSPPSRVRSSSGRSSSPPSRVRSPSSRSRPSAPPSRASSPRSSPRSSASSRPSGRSVTRSSGATRSSGSSGSSRATRSQNRSRKPPGP